MWRWIHDVERKKEKRKYKHTNGVTEQEIRKYIVNCINL